MKTILKDLLQADWGPTMWGIAWALGHAVMVPAAVAIVLAEWLAFTWRRPLAGVLALVPVRRPNPIDAINQGMAALEGYRLSQDLTAISLAYCRQRPYLLGSPNLADSSPNLADSSPNLADDGPPAREISDKAVAGIRAVVLGLAGSIEPPAPLPPVLAPEPRRQRRGSKRPQSPA